MLHEAWMIAIAINGCCMKPLRMNACALCLSLQINIQGNSLRQYWLPKIHLDCHHYHPLHLNMMSQVFSKICHIQEQMIHYSENQRWIRHTHTENPEKLPQRWGKQVNAFVAIHQISPSAFISWKYKSKLQISLFSYGLKESQFARHSMSNYRLES